MLWSTITYYISKKEKTKQKEKVKRIYKTEKSPAMNKVYCATSPRSVLERVSNYLSPMSRKYYGYGPYVCEFIHDS